MAKAPAAPTVVAAAPDTPATSSPIGSAQSMRVAERKLAALVGQPRECLDLTRVADKMGGEVTIAVSAKVMPSGRILRASADVDGHPSSAGACVAKRLENARIGAVQGAPINVTAQVQVVVKRTSPSKAPKSP